MPSDNRRIPIGNPHVPSDNLDMPNDNRQTPIDNHRIPSDNRRTPIDNPHPPNENRHQRVDLVQPARNHTMKTFQRRCLHRYINEEHFADPNDEPDSESDNDASMDDYTLDCSVTRVAVQFSEFSVTSWVIRRSNSTRCNCIVRSEFQRANGDTMSAFGRVLLFLEIATKEEGTWQTLVFLARMSVEIDEKLVYLVKT
jgi:hypothetical protein